MSRRIYLFGKFMLGSTAILVALVILSYATTSRQWDAGFPPTEIRLTVLDEQDSPVPGATLSVYDEGQQRIPDFFHEGHLVTDRNGELVCHQVVEGFQFGGHSWKLLWILRCGDAPPTYRCLIAAAGYKPFSQPVQQLVRPKADNNDHVEQTSFRYDGRVVEMKVLRRVIRLERD
jgi:hypothetical protein